MTLPVLLQVCLLHGVGAWPLRGLQLPLVVQGAHLCPTTLHQRLLLEVCYMRQRLLKAPYLSPAVAYTLLAAKVHAEKWDAPLKPLLTWLRASLYATRPEVTSLTPLELADYITIGRQNLQKTMVPRNHSSPAAPAPTYIIQSQPAPQAAPVKKKEPAEQWDLQATYMYIR